MLEQQELPQAEQSPHPAGISSISPFFTLRFIILFLAATKQASTKNAPGARMKIVIGVYIPLIVVNCIILGRAESYASKNPALPSMFDGIGMGLGFTCAITILGAIRELLGGGTILSTGSSALVDLSNFGYTPASIFILAPGAFFVLAMCVAVMNRVKRKHGMKPAEVPDYVSDEEKEN